MRTPIRVALGFLSGAFQGSILRVCTWVASNVLMVFEQRSSTSSIRIQGLGLGVWGLQRLQNPLNSGLYMKPSWVPYNYP